MQSEYEKGPFTKTRREFEGIMRARVQDIKGTSSSPTNSSEFIQGGEEVT